MEFDHKTRQLDSDADRRLRTLIEADSDYKHVKHVITHAMNLYDETPFYSEEEWEAQFPKISRNKLHKIFHDMADDWELRREVDRDSIPIKCRWTLRIDD